MATASLPRSTQLALCLAAQQGDRRAAEALVLDCAGLIRACARQYDGGNRYLRVELEQAGRIGVFEAIRHYDAARRGAFSTVAQLWIRAEVQAFLRQEYPGHLRRDPGHREMLSLDAPLHDGEMTLHDRLACAAPPPEDRYVMAEEIHLTPEVIGTLLSALHPIERNVVKRNVMGGESLEQVARTFNRSREWARKKGLSALETMRGEVTTHGRLRSRKPRALKEVA